MDTQIEVRSKSSELKDRITAHIQELAQMTDLARMSERMTEYLEMTARFHQYSPFNVWLILLQKPEATYVAGYNKWRQMSRWVCKGERGIPILAPIFTTVINEEGNEEKELTGFLTVYVFDVTQTDGKPLPEQPDWKSPEMDARLQKRLMQLAANRGIKVKVQCLPNDVQGASLGGLVLLSPEAGTKTLIHEIAHEILHQCEDAPKEKRIRELEAESVAFVVGRHFNLEGLESPNYVALHGATAELITEHIERIRTAAAQILTALETEIAQE